MKSLKAALISQDVQKFQDWMHKYWLPILVGVFLGALVLILPLDYLIFALGGLVFAYLLLFKIEAAVIVALLIQNQLGRFNYMGGGTPMHPNGIMGISIIAGAIFFFVFHKIDFSRFRVIGAFFAFLVVCIVTLPNTGIYFMDGLNITLRLVTSFSIYAILIYKLDSINKVKWVIGAIIAAQIIPTISGLLMYGGRSGLVFTDETMRLGNSGVGIYLAMISTLCLVFLFGARSISGRLLWGGLTALFLTGLFFSFGRSGWIGFVFALLLISLIRYKRLLILLPLVLILVIILVPAIGQRFSDISFGSDLTEGGSTFSQRLEFWQAALHIFPNNPLLGVGFGVGRYIVGEYRGLYAYMIHNDYVSVLLETGLIGFLLFIVWQYQWLAALVKTYRKSPLGFDKTVSLAVLAVFAASLVMRITDNILLDSYDMYPLCAMVAAVLAIPRIRADEHSSDSLSSPIRNSQETDV